MESGDAAPTPRVSPLAEWLTQHGVAGERQELVLEILAGQFIAHTVEALSECWEDLKPMILVGPRVTIKNALELWRQDGALNSVRVGKRVVACLPALRACAVL